MHRIPVFVLSRLLHAWVGWRIAPSLTVFPPAGLLIWGALATSALLMPLGLMGRRRANSPLSTVLVWAGLLCMGLFSTLFVMTLLRDALLVLVWAGVTVVQWLGLGGLDTRAMDALQTWSALAVLALGLLATIWGFWHARRTAQVVRVEVPIVGLPAALHGFTVAQISDIHVGPTIRQGYLQRIVTRVNALSVDLVAITGEIMMREARKKGLGGVIIDGAVRDSEAPSETQNRFFEAFQRFIGVFAKPEHPLALFLDDLQWADSASLKLIETLSQGDQSCIFIIGAYRDNEVNDAHPLKLSFKEIRESFKIDDSDVLPEIPEIKLNPLSKENTKELIADTLRMEKVIVRELADLIQDKTGGNPFFTNEFLKSLYNEEYFL